MDREDFDRWDKERKQRRAERDARRAERRQPSGGDSGSEPRDRKEKVLHTRITESLDEALRSAAGELRVPVSNLVRNVLEDVFDVVETVTENVEDLVEDLRGEAENVRESFRVRSRRRRPLRRFDVEVQRDSEQVERDSERVERDSGQAASESAADAEAEAEKRSERPAFEDILGWQRLVLNSEQRCVDCGIDLSRGESAYLGVGAGGPTRVYLCRVCLDARG